MQELIINVKITHIYYTKPILSRHLYHIYLYLHLIFIHTYLYSQLTLGSYLPLFKFALFKFALFKFTLLRHRFMCKLTEFLGRCRKAAVFFQKFARGRSARRRVMMQKQKIVKLQSFVRMSVAYLSYKHAKMRMIQLQGIL